ncbi:hypothetical protein V3C99_015313 [Haemonchus contortus]
MSRKTLMIVSGTLVVVVVLLVAAVVILIILASRISSAASKQLHEEDTADQSIWANCSRICGKPDYEIPHYPLVIISLNGFARSLVARDLPSLRKIARCGVTSESVYPCFGAENYTNSMAIVTGLFPESQGSYQSSNDSRAPLMEPIWVAYQKQTGGRVAVHSWPAAPHLDYGHPDYIVPSTDYSHPLQDQLDQVVKWLDMPLPNRPGLILVSNDDLIRALGRDSSDSAVTNALNRLDHNLDLFFTQLHLADILGCLNIVIVSDQGFARTSNRFDLSENVNLGNARVENGPVMKIFGNGSDVEEILRQFSTVDKDILRVFTRLSAPTRWHYSGSSKAVDLLVVGQNGNELCWKCNGKAMNALTAISEYQDQHMQTIFYASGPSIRSALTLPPFQNIELMNLWIELLKLEYVPNNGTIAFAKQILWKPQPRLERRKFGIRECPFTNEESVIDCGGCSVLRRVRLRNWMLTCTQPNRHLVLPSSSSSSVCYQKFCEKLIITGTNEDESVALVEIFHQNNTITSSQFECRFVSSRYDAECPTVTASEGQEIRTLSANPRKVLARIATIQVPWDVSFIKDVLDPLNAYTLSKSKEFGRVICITGTAFDRNLDGIADANKTGSPSHLYRVLIRCSSAWSLNGFNCRNPFRTEVLAFIFPHTKGDANGMAPEKFLLQYTARLKDVELIAGIEFDLPMVPAMYMMHLKLNVVTQLW